MLSSTFTKRALTPFSLSILAAALVSCGGGGGDDNSGDRLPANSTLQILSNPDYANMTDHPDDGHVFALTVKGTGTDLCPVYLNNSSNNVGSPSSSPVAVIYRRNGRTAAFSVSAQFTQSQVIIPGPITLYTITTATISANITYPNDRPSTTGTEQGTCVYSAYFEGTTQAEYHRVFQVNDVPGGLVSFFPIAS